MSRLLVESGEALYGERWQSELARDLGVADRTVRRWVAGATPVPPGVFADLLRMVVERQATLDDLVRRLPEAAAPSS
jgi:transposase-like protein